MTRYILNTAKQQKEMLETIGISSIDELYPAIPSSLILKKDLDLPSGKSEFAVLEQLKSLAHQNTLFKTILRGAGAEQHLIPTVVKQLANREEFVSAYTPYQSELSQGILQSIFEYQTAICELTGMDVSNASVYDGASAAAEAVSMVIEKDRRVILLAKGIHPQTKATLKTYTRHLSLDLIELEDQDGILKSTHLKPYLNSNLAGVFIQTPNYFGCLENLDELASDIHQAGGKLIAIVNPMTLGSLKSPRVFGADIAVGEAQPLGLPLAFGGPYLGFMAASSDLVRRLPGRIVGQTVDTQGRRAFALTLQAREQHIRREKASSSLCSNQALMALTASMYLASLGPAGLKEVSSACLSKAHYFLKQLESLGFKRKYPTEFFHEFVTEGFPSDQVESCLLKHNILSGLALSENEMLWCVTESSSKAQLDEVIRILKEELV